MDVYAAPARIFIEQRGGTVLTNSRAHVALDERGSIAGVTIGREMVRENPATLPIAALGWMVPFILLHNSIREVIFARWWMARYMQSCSLKRGVARIAEVTV